MLGWKVCHKPSTPHFFLVPGKEMTMESQTGKVAENRSFLGGILAFFGRILLAVAIPLISFYVLYLGFLFLRDSKAPREVIVLVAIVWGSGAWGFCIGSSTGLWRNFPTRGREN